MPWTGFACESKTLGDEVINGFGKEDIQTRQYKKITPPFISYPFQKVYICIHYQIDFSQ